MSLLKNYWWLGNLLKLIIRASQYRTVVYRPFYQKSPVTPVKIAYGKNLPISDIGIYSIKIPHLIDLKRQNLQFMVRKVFFKHKRLKFLSKSPLFDITVTQTISQLNLSKYPVTAEPIRATENYLKSHVVMMASYKCNMSKSPIYLVSMKFIEIFEIIHFEGCIFYKFLLLKI